MKRLFKRFLPILITAIFFTIIFSRIDTTSFLSAAANVRPLPLFAALIYFFIYPIVGIERWRRMITLKYPISYYTALKIYYIGETLNLILPSKAGDLSKSYFLKTYQVCPASFGASSVVFEKLLDLFALVFALLVGLIFHEAPFHFSVNAFGALLLFIAAFIIFLKADEIDIIRRLVLRTGIQRLVRIYEEAISFIQIIRRQKIRLFAFILVSIAFWLGHLFQIYLFFISANVPVSYADVIYYVPIAILIGLIPITIAGFGTRDMAFLTLLSSFAPPEHILVGSLLFSTRYFIPALFGLVFVNDYLAYITRNN